MPRKKELIILIFVLAAAGFLRFFNLMHDVPYFFDPDERNMANAVSGFRLPAKLSQVPTCVIGQFSQKQTAKNQAPTSDCNLNPHFFAYGQFPLYLAFVTDQIIKPVSNLFLNPPITNNQSLITTFPSAVFWLRFYSALSSVLIVLLVYLIAKPLLNPYFSLFAAFITAFTPGLIQAAHFGTTESLLTFLFLSSIYLSLRYLSNLGNLRFVTLTSLTVGLALGGKLTGIFFFVPPLIALIIQFIEVLKNKRRKNFINSLLGYWVIGLLILIGSIVFFILSSPYNLVDPADAKSAVFGYESDVATGKYEAFYTRQFVNTVSVLFQAEKIFPYALGWPVFILGSTGFLFMSLSLLSKLIQAIIQSIRYKVLRIRYEKSKNINILNTYYLILTTSFLFYLLPNAYLFAKWTRFMTPIFPFFAIFAGFLMYKLRSNLRLGYLPALLRKALQAGWVIGLLVFIMPGLAFMSIYTREDTRLTASRWIYDNIPNNSYILSETANVVDIPLGITNNQNSINSKYTVISFDFYHMDENRQIYTDLFGHLTKADYIFIPSRRIFANYPRLPQKYPLVTKYYQLLFSGALGFEKISEISSFPRLPIINYQLPDENAEETFTVFDHPVIRIYHKITPMTQEEYENLFLTK